jgi:uncharacterized protein (DUF3820 family)
LTGVSSRAVIEPPGSYYNIMTRGKRTKGQIMIYKTLHRTLKIEQLEQHLKPWLNSVALEELTITALLLTPVNVILA